ncbi:MAG: trypsin-like peptidase domain-containing protein [Actinomycetota bacterium]|nr:trypsin-like peptidase domain-containing protein [Actinomycetota bacterium]
MTNDPYNPPPARPPDSPWWAAGAQQDPWRDPRSAASWSAPTQQLPRPAGWGAPPAAPSGAPTGPPGTPTRRGTGAVVAIALVTGLLGGGVGGVTAYEIFRPSDHGVVGTTPTTPLGVPAAANRAPKSVAGIAAQVLPSVVSIQTTTSTGKGTGSGFVIRQDGYILTNNHVVAGAAGGGTIVVSFQDGSTIAATIVGRDAFSDVAVVKVARSGLKPVTLGDSSGLAVGDPVVAVGSPLGLRGTVTSGIISALDRPVQAGGSQGGAGSEANATYLSAIQTDAAINPGNSGGPLLDGAARVIGINSAIATLTAGSGQSGNIGLGFAIPINQAKRVAQQLIATGKATRTIIGASIDSSFGGPGARLNDVTAGAPAEKAGLRAGDIVTRFGNKVVDDQVSLIADIRAQEPGASVTVTYLRDGRKATATVVLAAVQD